MVLYCIFCSIGTKCLIITMETIMIRSTTVKKGNILQGKLPLQILFLCQWKTRNYASKSKKLLDQKRSNDSNVLQSINHDLMGSSSNLLITIDNNFHWKYNRWTNTDQNLNTYLHKNKQTIIQETQATVIISVFLTTQIKVSVGASNHCDDDFAKTASDKQLNTIDT